MIAKTYHIRIEANRIAHIVVSRLIVGFIRVIKQLTGVKEVKII